MTSENDTPWMRLGPYTPAKNRCHSFSTLCHGPSKVPQALLSASAAPIRGVNEASMISTSVQVSPPRRTRHSMSAPGTRRRRSQRSDSDTTCSRASSSSDSTEKTTRSKNSGRSASETLTTRMNA